MAESCLILWHLVKLGIAYEAVAKFPPRYVVGVELNDGTFKAPWSLHEDTVNHRRFCGEGEFDVKGFVGAVQRMVMRARGESKCCPKIFGNGPWKN